MACKTDDSNTNERYDNANHDRCGKIARTAEEERCQDRAQAGAGAKRERLTEGYAQIAHRETEGKTSYAPQNAEQGSQGTLLWVGSIELPERVALGNGEHCSRDGEDKPREDTLDEPIGLPAPLLDLVDGNVAARLAEGSHGDN